jgi:NAD-dependent deacetylase
MNVESLIDRAAADLYRSKYGIALTGAGVSTDSGIRDYRGPRGLWTTNPDAERAAYRRYSLFLSNPDEYWKEILTAGSLYSAILSADTNTAHRALVNLETMGFIKTIITQNIDGLHQKAGNRKVLAYHGSVTMLRCSGCGTRYGREEFDLQSMLESKLLPPKCDNCGAALKLDVVHFNEAIPSDVAEQSIMEAKKCDLMMICGTSAVVYPFAQLPRLARQLNPTTVIIEINAEPTPLTYEKISDYLIQGKVAEILPAIVAHLKAANSL